MAYVALAHREIGVKNGFSKSKYMYIQIKAFHVKVQSCIYKGTNPPASTYLGKSLIYVGNYHITGISSKIFLLVM